MSGKTYVKFEERPILGRTRCWVVLTLTGGALGEIVWFGRWRQYVFEPLPQTIYSPGCLDDIGAFCRKATAAQLAAARERRGDA